MYAKNEITKLVEAAFADAIIYLKEGIGENRFIERHTVEIQLKQYESLLISIDAQNLDVSLKSRDE